MNRRFRGWRGVHVVAVALVAFALIPSGARAAQSSQPVSSTGGLFEFHAGMWINLHHFLYEEAALSTTGKDASPREAELSPDASVTSALSTDEKAVWRSAVAYYHDNLLKRSLVSDDYMNRLKDHLGDVEDSTTVSVGDFDPALITVLNQAGPIYRAHWWPLHSNADQMWITAVLPMVNQNGDVLSQEIATAFEGAWHDGPLRVDVVAYANFAGSYATLHPGRITISSEDVGNQGVGALEMLFHAASATLLDQVHDVVTRSFAAAKKMPTPELPEAILFFTTGYYVRKLYPDYSPYADRADLWGREDWAGDRALLAKDWQMRLDGKITLDEALMQLAADLVPRERSAS
jgi:hypothetical protein